MFYLENKYLNYHLTAIIIVNFDNFTFCGTILSNDVIETSNCFFFLSNLVCYIQIKLRDHKLITLGTAVKNIHSNLKKIKLIKFYILSSLL